MATLARWCFRRRVLVVVLWLFGLAGLAVASQLAGNAYTWDLTVPDMESTRAMELVKSAFPKQTGEQDIIVWRVESGSVTDPEIRQRMGALLDQVARVPSVAEVTSPYSSDGAAQRSRDDRTAYARVTFTKIGGAIDSDDVDRIIDLAEHARTTGLRVELGGSAVQMATETPTSVSELVGFGAAAIILLIAFGSLLSMLTPLIIALVALVTSVMVIGLASHGLSIFNLAPALAALVGIGVGIDYALFIITRYRAGLKEGLSPEDAAVLALNTSGRAVVFAGLTVCVALLGMLTVNLAFISGIGISAAIMVFFTVLASCTLLPAMLGFFGIRILSRRERGQQRRSPDASDVPDPSGGSDASDAEKTTGGHRDLRRNPWENWAEWVARHPRKLTAVALAVIVLVAAPVFSLRLGFADQSNDPSGQTTHEAFDLMADAFGPGGNGPLLLVATMRSQRDAEAFATLPAIMSRVDGVASAQVASVRSDAGIGIIQVIPTTAPQAEETGDLIRRIREKVIPSALSGTTMRVYVSGQTATGDDFAETIGKKLPLFLLVVLSLGFLLLLIAFRSILVPLTAAIMNLLSAGAAFGVVVAVFQWGWGEHIGLGAGSPVEAFLPVLMLAVLFGLSMDYQVFLISRMHEEWVRTGDNGRAVVAGQAVTARVITAAAAIMICVFCAFAMGGDRTVAEFGVGLASVVFIDAFILRTVLVPALMQILGKANWWLPQFIDSRMPHLSVEPDDTTP